MDAGIHPVREESLPAGSGRILRSMLGLATTDPHKGGMRMDPFVLLLFLLLIVLVVRTR